MISGIVSTFSYVVKRFPHVSHCRRRRIELLSSTGRESITLVSAALQNGHFNHLSSCHCWMLTEFVRSAPNIRRPVWTVTVNVTSWSPLCLYFNVNKKDPQAQIGVDLAGFGKKWVTIQTIWTPAIQVQDWKFRQKVAGNRHVSLKSSWKPTYYSIE